MNIRTVTCFINLDHTQIEAGQTAAPQALRAAGELAAAARAVFPGEGYTVQTTRLGVPPLAQLVPAAGAVEFGIALEQAFRTQGFDYGAVRVDAPELYEQAPEMIRRTENLFVSLPFAEGASGIDFPALLAAARIIHVLAATTPGGWGNFRFAATANCPPNIPFFPAAYHDGTARCFALGMEAADLVVDAFSRATSLNDARQRLVDFLEREGYRLRLIGEGLEEKYGLRFAGIDFSPAPFPEEAQSIGTALERLTGRAFGERGTLFAAGFVTDCIRRADFPRTGFNGLMLPVMEDWTLGRRAQEEGYTLDSLLLYSTVCSLGLDCVPLPGAVTEGELGAILLDLATLAVKLDKPLSARLMPVPGKGAGEMTDFPSQWFANTRILATRGELPGWAAGEGRVELAERGHR